MTATPKSRALPAYDHTRGAGPTLVFLHYWGGSARTWRPVIEELPSNGILALDFRGWGRSSALPGPYTLEHFAQDTVDVLADAGVDDLSLIHI